MGLLSVEQVVAGYSAADEILKGIDLTLDQGQAIAIIGPNGAGKSTLLKVIAGILTPSRGRVRLREREIQGLAPRRVSELGVAFVPQEHNIFPTMSVVENLEMGGYLDARRAKANIAEMLERFPMLQEKRRQAARTLSGGQRQILAMAMALMVEPTVLLLDEPSAGLAPLAAESLFESIRRINDEGLSIIMVEQNALEALAIADQGYILVDGRNSMTGPAKSLAEDPEVRRIFLGG
jgi:branched-chain amino acid transport system ATP-binding protein